LLCNRPHTTPCTQLSLHDALPILNPDGYTDHDEHLEHREFVTTNPSLWRHEFVARHPWPKKPHSEAVFAREVFANPDAVSGYWGARGDDPWVIHDGERTGSGY